MKAIRSRGMFTSCGSLAIAEIQGLTAELVWLPRRRKWPVSDSSWSMRAISMSAFCKLVCLVNTDWVAGTNHPDSLPSSLVRQTVR